MPMILKRPLLFIYPLSPSLQKYLEFAKESAEEEGFEIYELDILGEALQLIPTVGASLVLGSSPKKLAQILQSTRKVLHQQSSKVLLLTDKALPSKLVQKLQKIGLTEYLQEPVNPKTLIYKVGLLLKSLPIESLEEQTENEEVVFASEEKIDKLEKQRIEKGVLSEFDEQEDEAIESAGEIDLKLVGQDQTKAIDVELELTSSQQSIENPISLELSVPRIDQEDQEEEDKDQNSDISTYYKSYSEESKDLFATKNESTIKRASQKDQDELMTISEQAEHLHLRPKEKDINDLARDEENASEKEKNELADEFELNLDKSNDDQKDEISLDLSQPKRTAKASDQEHEQSIQKITEEEELELALENEKKKLLGNLNLDTAELRNKEKDNERHELSEANKAKQKKEAAIDLAQEETGTSNIELSPADQSKSVNDSDVPPDESLEVSSLQDIELLKKKSQEQVSSNLDLNPNDKKVEFQEAEELTLTSERKKKSAQELSIDDQLQKTNEKNTKGEKEASLTLTDSERLNISPSNADEEQNRSLEINRAQAKEKQETELHIDGQKDVKSDRQDVEDNKLEVLTDNQLNLSLTDKKRREDKDHALVLERGSHKKEKDEQESYDWENLRPHEKMAEEGNWVSKKKKSIEIVFEKDKKGGEEIDYRKLKKAFENAPMLDHYGKKDKGDRFENDRSTSQTGGGQDAFRDRFEDIIDDRADEEDDQASQKTIYPATSNGIEHLIKVLQMYQEKRSDKSILLYICNILYKQFAAYGGYFNLGANNTFDEFFSSPYQIEYSGDRQQLIEKWEQEKKDGRANWQLARVPMWKNEKFTSGENGFVYPFYEGIDQMGFAYFIFQNGVTEKEASQMEMIIEGARGIYLEQREMSKPAGFNKTEANESNDKKSSGGIFGRFFKGKAK